ncbi:MAG TPA: outer membrane protein assembly factor BamD [Bryobacteraceae bacterium]|jgi:outer membrane protein assembly factor BamD|nr:outer membrane protein assembly factor BamD [Bryobacteraceae bacterium]
MLLSNIASKRSLVAALSLAFLGSCVHKYETPIAKNTQQPDKVLFDQAMRDIEHGRYEVARISLQTLMNTYESSEYLAKAKLAIADSWYREGGANGMAQAEAEYKDFILFYPGMEEAAEAQNRVCDIHYKQMDKSDRDWSQTVRAEDECKAVLTQFPNSKFAPQAMQRVRDIQESLAEHEFVVGNFYWKREMNPAAANRLNALVDQYPLFSDSGEALYEAGDSYSKMGPRFRKQAGEMFARILREYPLSNRAEDAKGRLQDMELPIPQADPNALARAKFEQANYHRPGIMSDMTSWMRGSPDVSHAAKSGQPTMTDPKRTIPASVPVVNTEAANTPGTSGVGTTDVSATTVNGSSSMLDKSPDARNHTATAQTASEQTNQPLPTNRDKELKKYREQAAKKQAALEKKKKKANKDQQAQQQQGQAQQNQSNATQGAQTPTGASNAVSTPAAGATTQQPSQNPPSHP